jgi:hypothetical protein
MSIDNIKRFDKVLGSGYEPSCHMEEAFDGDWVEWEAHSAIVTKLESEAEALAKQRNSASTNAGNLSILLTNANTKLKKLQVALEEIRPLLIRFSPRPHELDRIEEILEIALRET